MAGLLLDTSGPKRSLAQALRRKITMNRKSLILALSLLAVGICYWGLTAEPPAQGEELVDFPPVSTGTPGDTRAESPEETQRRKLLGVWQDEHMGAQRTMVLNDDGTGTMHVKTSGWRAIPFGPKLRFDMKWRLEDNKLCTRTIDGEPSDKVKLVLKTYGNFSEDTILEHSDDRLLLLDRNGTTKYDWKRPGKDDKKTE
jgi:hypothetical protein